MKILTTATGLALAALTFAPAGAEDAPSKGEAKLAKLLEGRVAGEPVNCVQTFPGTKVSIIDGTAIVVRRPGVVYVNVPLHPEDLDEDDAMVTRTFGTRLCSSDQVTTRDRNAGHYTGNIFLGEFVPYRRADS